MKRLISALIISGSVIIGAVGRADHPNEGKAALEELTQEALANSLSIAESKSTLESAKAAEKAARGAFFPELSAVGASIANRLDEEKNSGTAIFGRAEWNVYRGGRDQAELSHAKALGDFAEKKSSVVQAEVARNVARLYYEMLFLTESAALKEKAIQLNDEQIKLAKAKRSSGFTSEADVIEFELREATLRSDLKQIAQDREEKARELMVVLGRRDVGPGIEVKGHLVRDDRVPRKAALMGMIDKGSEILSVDAELSEARRDQAIARSGLFPRVDVDAKYGRLSNEERVFAENNNYSVEVRVTVPLFSGLSSVNEISATRAKSAAKELERQRKRASASSTAESFFLKLSSLKERLDLEEKTLARSEEYYKITVGEYRRGVKNSPDMVGATERLLEARIRNLEFRKEFYLTRLSLEELVGVFPLDKTLY